MTKLSDLQPDAANANRGTAKGQKMIVSSLQEDGFGRSGLLDKRGRIIAGNKTAEASAEVFGVDADVIVVESDGTKPVYVQRTDLDLDTDVAARRMAYRDNIASAFSFELDPEIVLADIDAGFDFDALGVTLPDLSSLGVDVGANGGPPEPPAPVDKAEQLQEKWQVEYGNLYALGDHRLLCGDCREPGDVARLVDGVKVNGVFTSPPYAEQRKKQYGGVPVAEYVEWWQVVQENVRNVLAEDGSFFVNIKPHCENGQRVLYVFDLVLAMVRKWGWRFVDELCWTYQGVPGKWTNRFKNGFEPIYHFTVSARLKFTPSQVMTKTTQAFEYSPSHPKSPTNSGFLSNPGKESTHSGMAYPNNVMKCPTGTAGNLELSHSAQFPLTLPTFFIKAYSDPGDIWLDPFCGSGTTIIAADNEGRTGYGIEKLEKYCSVVLERYHTHTGSTPELIEMV